MYWCTEQLSPTTLSPGPKSKQLPVDSFLCARGLGGSRTLQIWYDTECHNLKKNFIMFQIKNRKDPLDDSKTTSVAVNTSEAIYDDDFGFASDDTL